MTLDSRKAVLDRIRKLLQMTESRGASESEAAAALEKATRLMEEHDVTERDVELSVSEFGGYEHRVKGMRAQRSESHPVQWVCAPIQILVGVRMAYSYDVIVVIGRRHETEIACFMVDMLRTAIDNAWVSERPKIKAIGEEIAAALGDPSIVFQYIKTNTTAKCRTSFKIGVATRLAKRILELAARRRDGQASAGNGIVVVRDAMLDATLFKHLPDCKEQKPKTPTLQRAAFLSGLSAGEKIPLSQGIGGQKSTVKMVERHGNEKI